jgi:hypothetical protein
MRACRVQSAVAAELILDVGFGPVDAGPRGTGTEG